MGDRGNLTWNGVNHLSMCIEAIDIDLIDCCPSIDIVLPSLALHSLKSKKRRIKTTEK